MEKLPPLVLRRILHYATLPTDPRRQNYGPESTILASTCRAFQKIVEQKTFRRLYLDKERAVEAIGILSRYRHRIASVKEICFTVILPEYDFNAYNRFETPTEQRVNSWVFTVDMGALFRFLPCLDTGSPSQRVELFLVARSPTDCKYAGAEAVESFRDDFTFHIPGDYERWRYYMSTLCLLGQRSNVTKAVFPFINHLWLCHPEEDRNIGAETMGWITSRFNNVYYVDWFFCDNAKGNLELRRANRSDQIPTEDRHPNQFRYTPKQDLLDEFYLAAAHATTRMPKLRRMLLDSINHDPWHVMGSHRKWHVVSFDNHKFRLEIEGRVGTATWTGCPSFAPSKEVIKAWEKLAYDRNIKLAMEFVVHAESDHREEALFEDAIEDSIVDALEDAVEEAIEDATEIRSEGGSGSGSGGES
ncbi:hypothetical protein SLS62_003669 [Diatrype stigma]|uniref:DUF6546 domain-containing protein n=1 Tax=Diatrype stigma TaxID=117547 RepID=A0AAN9UUT4_9PEZI